MNHSKGTLPAAMPDDPGRPLGIPESAVAPAIARELALIKTMTDMAMRRPRVDAECAQELYATCDDPLFADEALYEFPRGGEMVIGPSIEMAREVSRIWGNNIYGLTILDDSPDQVLVEGYVIDLQNNRRIALQSSFLKLIQRTHWENGKKITKWVRPNDEREVRELINRNGAFVQRNAILGLVPKMVIEKAVAIAEKALERVATGDNRGATVAKLVEAFAPLGVPRDRLEAYVRKPLDQCGDKDLASLRRVYRAIQDGAATVDSCFPSTAPAGAQPSAGPATLDDLTKKDSRDRPAYS